MFWALVVTTFVVFCVVPTLLHALKPRTRISSRVAREPTKEGFEDSFKLITQALAEDINVPADRLYPDDELRRDLGYTFDHVGMEDAIEDAFRVVAARAAVSPLVFAGCVTLCDLAITLQNQRSALSGGTANWSAGRDGV